MNFKYLAFGILVGYLAPYALALIKAKKDPDSPSSKSRSIYNNNDDDDEQNEY
jgi:hypothetical protein